MLSSTIGIPRGVRASVSKSLKQSECLKRCAFQCIKSLKMGFCKATKSEIRLKSELSHPCIPKMGILLLTDSPKLGVDELEGCPSLTGDILRVRSLARRGERLVGGDAPLAERREEEGYPIDSSSFLVSCSRRRGSRVGSRETEWSESPGWGKNTQNKVKNSGMSVD